MSHQPYETWIADEASLSSEQRRELQQHLQVCPECYQLQLALHAVEDLMLCAPIAAPQAGFSQRWRSHLAERLTEEQRRQTRRMFLTLIISALLVLLVLVNRVMLMYSPVDMMASGLQFVSQFLVRLDQIQNVFIIWARFLPLYVPVAAIMIAATIMCFWTFVWGVSVWKINMQGVTAS
jgi:predicted nucleic acid-binding Zn ribbon protein